VCTEETISERVEATVRSFKVEMNEIAMGTGSWQARRLELLRESKEQTLELNARETLRLRRLRIIKNKASRPGNPKRNSGQSDMSSDCHHPLVRSGTSVPRKRISPAAPVDSPMSTQIYKKRKAENTPTPSSKAVEEPHLKRQKLEEAGELVELDEWVILEWVRNNQISDEKACALHFKPQLKNATREVKLKLIRFMIKATRAARRKTALSAQL
jgi:hypothetical protein